MLSHSESVVRSTDRPAMTIAVDLGRKATKQTKQNNGDLLAYSTMFDFLPISKINAIVILLV